MQPHLKYIAMLLIGPILGLYGWWCLFRTESAIEFGRNIFVGESGNWTLTKIHGVVFSLFGVILFLTGVFHFLNRIWY